MVLSQILSVEALEKDSLVGPSLIHSSRKVWLSSDALHAIRSRVQFIVLLRNDLLLKGNFVRD